MKPNKSHLFSIVLPICVLLCLALWLLKMPPVSVTVDSRNGVWNLRGIDFSKTCAHLTGYSEYVPNALLTPDEFAASDDISTGALPDGTEYATFRMRLLLSEDQIVALAGNNSGNASRVYVNGRLLESVGEPGATKETTASSARLLSFTVWPEDGVVEIVEQTANFVHKDNLESSQKFYVGSESTIANMTARDNAFPAITIGIYLLLFIVQLLLFLTLPSYRANLWLALLCLTWALRTGATGVKIFITLFPWLTWQVAFRIEYLSIPVSLLLLALTYRELFPRALQKGFRIAVYIFVPLTAAVILFTDTKLFSNFGVPITALCGVAAAYVLVRIVWTARKPNTEQRIVLAGLGVLLLSVIADTLYFNNATSSLLPGSVTETVLILFSMFQMTALLYATMRETAAAKAREQQATADKAELERVNRLKSNLIAIVSHEIRTPLTVISTHAQLADKAVKKGNYADPSLERLGVITREANRLADLSGNLLQAFKEGKPLRGRTALSVGELITQTAKAFKPIMDKKRNRQTVQIEPNLLPVSGNADELTQVLFNLLANADAHTKNGGITITAKLADDGSFIAITVSDTGEGISPELLPHVFEKGGHDEQGTGYGLAICREIIEAHGGSVAIESEQGKGTSVTFTLPTIKEAGAYE